MTATAFPRLFISYSRVDSAFVDRLEQDLAVRDVHVWVDRRKLEGSQIWAAEIQKGIDQAEIVLVVVSPEAMASEWVQREISYAVGKHKPIIPLVWRSADVPITIFNLQALPFEGRYENGLRELLVTLTKIPTMPTPISHATPSIATMDAPAPAVRLVQPVAPPPAPDADLNNLFIAAIAAETSSDIERALLFFEQITARDPQFGNGFAARKITDLAPRVIEQRIQRLRERARAATTANEWHAAAGAWDALLTIVPDDSEARDGVHDELLHIMQNAADQGDWGEALGACAAVIERFPGNVTANAAQGILRQNYDAAWLYDNARVLADAGDAPSARAMLGVLWQQAPHFGDPSGVTRDLGLTVAAFPSLPELVISSYIAETHTIMVDPTRQDELLLATLHGHSNDVQSVAWSPDGTRLVSGSFDFTVRVWEVSTGKILATLFRRNSGVISVAWSPDGTHLAFGGFDKIVRVWDMDLRKELAALSGHTGYVTSVGWSPDGKRLVSGSYDRMVRVWDASTYKELAILNGHSGSVTSVAWSPDGTRLASGGHDKMVRVWDANTNKELATLHGSSGYVMSVAWSPDGTRLASGSGDNTSDDTIRVWDTSTYQKQVTLPEHNNYIRSMAWSPDGTRLISGGNDMIVRMWDASIGKELATLHGHSGGVRSVAWSPDGTRLASSSFDKTICIWRA